VVSIYFLASLSARNIRTFSFCFSCKLAENSAPLYNCILSTITEAFAPRFLYAFVMSDLGTTKAGLMGETAGHVPGAPAYKGHKNITGINLKYGVS
jgi:hypothetical protein